MRPWLAPGLALLVSIGNALGCASTPDCPATEAPAPSTPPDAAAPEAAAPEAEAAPTVVLLVRHAEKADDGTEDPPLTDRGRARAECLAAMLDDFAPTHLLTTQYQRNRATLDPLAAATGLQPIVIEAKDAAAWQRALAELPPGARAVVAGHSNTLPSLVASLGGRSSSLDAQGNIPHDEYDRLIHVVVGGHAQAVAYTTVFCPSAP